MELNAFQFWIKGAGSRFLRKGGIDQTDYTISYSGTP